MDISKACKPDNFELHNLHDSIGSGNFPAKVYILLIQKDSSTHVHGLAVYIKEGLPFAWDLSLENCRFLLMFSTGFTSFSVLLFFLYHSPSSSLCMVFDSISFNVDEVLSINPSAVFVFEDFNVYHND